MDRARASLQAPGGNSVAGRAGIPGPSRSSRAVGPRWRCVLAGCSPPLAPLQDPARVGQGEDGLRGGGGGGRGERWPGPGVCARGAGGRGGAPREAGAEATRLSLCGGEMEQRPCEHSEACVTVV